MVILMDQKREEDQMTLGSVYVTKLAELAEKDQNVISLEADLLKAVGTGFIERFPERTFDCGVQEANMVGMAAGFSAVGMVPYAHSFGTFLTRRVFDQIFISAAYARLNVKLMGSDPGITAAYNGGTHMPFEDTGVMRMVPGATVIDITDRVMLQDIMEQIKELYGIFYVRFPRSKVRNIYAEGSRFDIGKGAVLKHGSAATIIASGILVAEALEAAEMLEEEGLHVRVVDMFTVKPVDRALVMDCARETGAIVTAENHNIIGGLGDAVAEVLVENCPVPMERIGARDKFGEVGEVEYLKKAFWMTSCDIAEKTKRVIQRKKG